MRVEIDDEMTRDLSAPLDRVGEVTIMQALSGG
jgi:hypothetical protein